MDNYEQRGKSFLSNEISSKTVRVCVVQREGRKDRRGEERAPLTASQGGDWMAPRLEPGFFSRRFSAAIKTLEDLTWRVFVKPSLEPNFSFLPSRFKITDTPVGTAVFLNDEKESRKLPVLRATRMHTVLTEKIHVHSSHEGTEKRRKRRK